MVNEQYTKDFEQAFSRHFPKLCERPALYPYREDIKTIVANVIKDLSPQMRDDTAPFHHEL